ESSRKIVGEILESWGMHAILCGGGEAALARLTAWEEQEGEVSLIVVDRVMPGVDGIGLAKWLRSSEKWKNIPIVMMSSVGGSWKKQELDEVGIAQTVNKPVKHGSLLNEVMGVLGLGIRESPEVGERSAERPRNVPALNILLAEDGKANQVVAVRLLEKRGHRVTVAENGKEALEMLENLEFDAVLMDMQMPIMNGFEATAAIREREATHGGHIPVIAITAHAMPGDREECLAAGMDDYIA
ncbi:MAG: response regulator, partial [Akkermansiaceae bacterium]|nr:response regulator [Akkermansiaceae bacterium]